MPDNRYNTYVRREWEMFLADPGRLSASLAAVQDRPLDRVLDVGCGAGQELIPFLSRGSFGVGIDVASGTGLVGRELHRGRQPDARVTFVRAAAEHLPFADGSFDVVVCRLALPYMANGPALAEIARVLHSRGTLLLKIHHARYYIREFVSAFRHARIPVMIHALRALINGTIYHFLGWQCTRKPIGLETFQTRWRLRRVIAPLEIVGEMSDSNPLTPSLVITGATRRQ